MNRQGGGGGMVNKHDHMWNRRVIETIGTTGWKRWEVDGKEREMEKMLV